MGLFKKKDKVIDLTSYYQKNKDKFDKAREKDNKPEYEDLSVVSGKSEISSDSPSGSDSGGFFGGFFGSGSNSGNTNSTNTYPQSTDVSGISESVNPDERRRKLAKRLSDMTSKIEDLSNQIYHLQQRLELVERKLDINKF